MIRIGAPSSDSTGCALEVTCSGTRRRVSIRAWSPFTTIPTQHYSIEEFAAALGLTVPPRSEKRRGRNKV